jgi:signal transduction histidine kinase/ligand-binding sensor domain-containing protein/DNA-binding response OmpR family regulator
MNAKVNVLRKIVGLFVAFYIFSPSEAQQDRFYTPAQGLSNTMFEGFAQDNDGNIWIATDDGLNKFNGYNFEIYNNNPLNEKTLDNNLVTALFLDSKGTLWVGTNLGLHQYNKNLDNFNRYPIKLRNRIITTRINKITEDKYNNLWLVSAAGVIKVNPQTNIDIFYNYKLKDSTSLFRNPANDVTIDNNGIIWIGSEKNGLLFYDPLKNKFSNYHSEQINNSIIDNSILSLGKDRSGNIIIGTFTGICIFDPYKNKFKNIPLFSIQGNIFNGGSYSIVTDNDGVVWVGTQRNGLKILVPELGILKDANKNIDVEDVNNATIRSFCDRQGNLWLGIDHAGLYKIKGKGDHFYSLKKGQNGQLGLSKNNVSSILCDNDNNLWIGTDGGGLNLVRNKSNNTTVFKHIPDNTFSIPDNAVIAMYEDNSSNIWIGTYLGGLSLFDRKREVFKTYLIDPTKKDIEFNYVASIKPDQSGNLWVATSGGGLQYFNTETKKFKSYTAVCHNNRSISLPLFLTTLFIDKENSIWIGSYNGLYYWNNQKGYYWEYSVSTGKLRSDIIYSIIQDSHNIIWVGTSSGLYKIKNENEIKNYSTDEGLPNNSVFGILEDNKGCLWLSTLNGLSKFDPGTVKFCNYFTYDGLPGNEFHPASCYKAKNGYLYFGSTSGLVYFNPDSIIEQKGFPTIIFTGLKIFNSKIAIGKLPDGRTILNEAMNETHQITLLHSDNSFTIDFAAINFAAPEKIKYAYCLQGFDQKWTNKDYNQRNATYTNLNPGTYIFKLKTTNIYNVWNSKVKEVIIVIKPPLWQAWWAYFIYTALFALGFILVRKQMLFRIKMRNKLHIEHLEIEKLEELNQSKMQFFSNVSHEFRTPLTLILGPIERLLYSNNDTGFKKQIELIHRNALRLLRLVNLLLDLQKVEKSEMHLRARLGDLVSFIQEITLSFEELAQQKKIELLFNSEVSKLEAMFDPDKLDKVLFNLLSNAFKFTSEGAITVELSVKKNDTSVPPGNDLVRITVTDSGKGMKQEYLQKIFERFYQIEESDSEMQIGTGIGLHLSKHLVELHGGKITVSSKTGDGTRFEILIPLGIANPKHEEINENTVASSVPQYFDLSTIQNVDGPGLIENLDKNLNDKKKLPKPTVLIVEDEFEIRTYIKSELLDQYNIIEAIDGEEGWRAAQKEMPDLIISDIMMPKMDGIELCKNIKTNLKTSHIPVILLTARTSIENRIEGIETGADSYIPKPFHPQHLLIRVEKLIELRRVLINKFSKSIGFEAKEMTLTTPDEKFLQKAMDLVKENISNTELNIEDMGSELGMSRAHLFRKLKALTNQNPSEFVRTIRLKQAAYLLSQKKISISEVAFSVGFSSHQYFSNCFQNYFGMSPTEYSQKN